MHFSSFSILATLAITTSFLPPLSIVTTIKNKFSSKNKMVEPKDGYYFLKSPHTIKDPETAGNIGLLPRGPAQPLALRIANLMDRLDSLTTDLDKYCLLHSILETDATLYFGTILRDVQKIMPLVYTPTVGEGKQYFPPFGPPSILITLPPPPSPTPSSLRKLLQNSHQSAQGYLSIQVRQGQHRHHPPELALRLENQGYLCHRW